MREREPLSNVELLTFGSKGPVINRNNKSNKLLGNLLKLYRRHMSANHNIAITQSKSSY